MPKGKTLTQYDAARRKRTLMATLLILIVIPLLIFIGVKYLKNSYMVVSLVVLVSAMIPFFVIFERRKPKAREIVLIAMLTALTVCAQMFFHITVPIQIGTALIIISGISLGPEAGFLIGALARFVCNFYMGQGPWTPWQMFCWGILGFLAGLAFNKTDLETIKSRNFKVVMGPVFSIVIAGLTAYVCYLIWPNGDNSFWGYRLYLFGALGLVMGMLFQRKRLPVDNITVTLFTFFTTFIVYGGLMNICAMVTSAATPGSRPISFETLRILYLSGAPYDALHAATAALCTFLFGDSIIRKIERIKIKYGIYR